MGSRKKHKPVKTQRVIFWGWYRGLSIMDRIAFKSYMFNCNRSRISLYDLWLYPYFWQIGPLKRDDYIRKGYSIRWWVGFDRR